MSVTEVKIEATVPKKDKKTTKAPEKPKPKGTTQRRDLESAKRFKAKDGQSTKSEDNPSADDEHSLTISGTGKLSVTIRDAKDVRSIQKSSKGTKNHEDSEDTRMPKIGKKGRGSGKDSLKSGSPEPTKDSKSLKESKGSKSPTKLKDGMKATDATKDRQDIGSAVSAGKSKDSKSTKIPESAKSPKFSKGSTGTETIQNYSDIEDPRVTKGGKSSSKIKAYKEKYTDGKKIPKTGTKISGAETIESDSDTEDIEESKGVEGKRGKSSSKGEKLEDSERRSAQSSKGEEQKIDKKPKKGKKEKLDKVDFATLLDTVEQQREKELRVINQRRLSTLESNRTPTPMASMDSIEKQYEKLLVVKRVSKDDVDADKRGSSGFRVETSKGTPRLSVVTQDQFAELLAVVRELQSTLGPVGTADFPENAELMKELRKGASLTDAMAALQLSARLDATEKTIEQMLPLITELAKITPSAAKSKEVTQKDPGKNIQESVLKSQNSKNIGKSLSAVQTGSKIVEKYGSPSAQEKPRFTDPKKSEETITFDELETTLQEFYEYILKKVGGITTKITANADTTYKKVRDLDVKLKETARLEEGLKRVEALVSDFADHINIIDTSLSSQMTSYQEQITQLQYELELGLENMAETLANSGEDTSAMAEMNSKFISLQKEYDVGMHAQTELKEMLEHVTFDIGDLWKQLEILREIKSDRDEVEDALKDKAGIGDLNGIVSQNQFDAVRGDFEKRVASAYDKFNNQEHTWQKVIDELQREINEKADWTQVAILRDDIKKKLEKLNSRIREMKDVVGEPRAAALTRTIHRDTVCLSCSSPAHMILEEPGIVPALPAFGAKRPPALGAEADKPREDGDHGVCYPGQPIPQPLDPRTHICQRYCGGSHTIISGAPSRAPPFGMTINPAVRHNTTEIGCDGKTYFVDNQDTREKRAPCSPYIIPQSSFSRPLEAEILAEVEQQGEMYHEYNDMTPLDYQQSAIASIGNQFSGNISVTPPPPSDD